MRGKMKKSREERVFHWTLILTELLRSKPIEALFPETVGKLPYGYNMKETVAQIVSSAFELLILVMHLKVVWKLNENEARALFEAFAPNIQERLAIVEKAYMTFTEGEDLPANIDKKALGSVAVGLATAKRALEEGKCDVFIEAIDSTLESMGISKEPFENELKNIVKLASLLHKTVTEDIESAPTTETIMI
jgi:hypothetical protein